MLLLNDLLELNALFRPITLTIGNFDGVHLGHAAILDRVLSLSTKDCPSLVLTFTNHPSTILLKRPPAPLLTSLDHKIKLFEEKGIDYCLALPFTERFASQTAWEFLSLLKSHVAISHLVLGHDATLGKNREGGRKEIQEIADTLGFTLTYCNEFKTEGIVSSSAIRHLIKEGKLTEAAAKLGRPWSIYGKIIHGEGLGKPLGFPTANLIVDSLVLPPQGVYSGSALGSFGKKRAIINLGLAPTVGKRNTPILEAMVLDYQGDLYGQFIEVIFDHYLRPEITFESKEALQKQIEIDLSKVL